MGADRPAREGPDGLDRGRLAAGAAALGLALDEPRLDRLLAYQTLLQHWGRVYNLTALRDADTVLTHHLLDCLAVVGPLRRAAVAWSAAPLRIVDVGSGGGLPGAVLAIVEPAWQVTCIDAAAKKAAFVRQVAAELALPNLSSFHGRVEAFAPAGVFDVVTSRAFASLSDTVRLTRRLLAPGGMWMAMKGRVGASEAASLPEDVEMFHVEQLRVPGLDAQRSLVWLRPR